MTTSPSMTEKFPRWPLFASLFAYFVLTAALIATVPLGASPDEAAHWQYVEHLATLGTLPVFGGAVPPAPGYEFHQPPLYYAICAPLWKLVGAGVQNYACRLVSLICGLLTIWVIWSAAKLTHPKNWRVAAVAAGFAALLPLNQAVGAGTNNDGLSGLICATLFYLVARAWTNGPTWRDAWQLGVVAGLGILTKNTTLSVSAACFVSFFAALLRTQEENAPRPIMGAGAAVGIALLIGGPILVRNTMLYGDALAQSAFKATFSQSSPGPAALAQIGIDSIDYIRNLAFVAFCTLWGFFGGPNTVISQTHLFSRSPQLIQGWLVFPMAVCALLPLLAIPGWRKSRLEDESLPSTKAVNTSWALGITFVALAWAQFAAQYFAGAQARYGHAALLPVCVFLAAGWVGFWGRGRALAIASTFFALVLITLTILNVSGWKTLV